jgi:hypothetical protein
LFPYQHHGRISHALSGKARLVPRVGDDDGATPPVRAAQENPRASRCPWSSLARLSFGLDVKLLSHTMSSPRADPQRNRTPPAAHCQLTSLQKLLTQLRASLPVCELNAIGQHHSVGLWALFTPPATGPLFRLQPFLPELCLHPLSNTRPEPRLSEAEHARVLANP